METLLQSLTLFLLPVSCSSAETHSVLRFLLLQWCQMSRPVWICSTWSAAIFTLSCCTVVSPGIAHTLAPVKPLKSSVSDQGNLMSLVSCVSYLILDPPGSPALQEARHCNGQCQLLLILFKCHYFTGFLSLCCRLAPWFYMGSAFFH